MPTPAPTRWTEPVLAEVRALIHDGATSRQLAERYGVAHGHMKDVLQRHHIRATDIRAGVTEIVRPSRRRRFCSNRECQQPFMADSPYLFRCEACRGATVAGPVVAEFAVP